MKELLKVCLKLYLSCGGFCWGLRSFPAPPCFTVIHIHIWELHSATTVFYCWLLVASLLVQLEVKCHAQGHLDGSYLGGFYSLFFLDQIFAAGHSCSSESSCCNFSTCPKVIQEYVLVKPLEMCTNTERPRKDKWDTMWTDINVQHRPTPHILSKLKHEVKLRQWVINWCQTAKADESTNSKRLWC